MAGIGDSVGRTRLRLDGYVRVSKVGGRSGDGFISPDVQSEALQRWADERGHLLTLRPPELDKSGGTMDRPVFNDIMGRIERRESDGILVYRVDRFARSLLGALNTLADIERAGGTFASVSDQLDLTTPQGRAFLHIQLVMAELFREQVREGFATSTARAIRRGIHISNAVPVGYDRNAARILVPNGDAPAIRELFTRRAQGEGASSLGRFLDNALPRPNGETWTPAHVRSLLSMRVYTGEAYHGTESNPSAHEAIVSRSEWQAAQDARNVSTPRSGEFTGLLTGVVRCAGCRYLMTPSKAGLNGSTLTYRCRKNHTAGRCPAPAVVARSMLDEHVEQAALRLLSEAGDVTGGDTSQELETAVERLGHLKEELAEFAADTEARRLLGDGYHDALHARVRAVRECEHELDRLSGGVAADLSELDGGTFEERRLILSRMLDGVFVRSSGRRKVPIESRVWIAWRGDGPDDLPRRGAANGPVRPVAWPEGEAGVPAA